MKSQLSKLSSLFILCLLTHSAGAIILFQDNFNYPDGILTNGTWVAGPGNTLNNGVSISGGTVIVSASGASQPRTYFTNGLPGFSFPTVTNFNHVAYYFDTNTPVAALYFSYLLNVSGATNSYHAYLCDTNFNFVCRIYASTNTAGTGFRIGVGNSTTLSAATNSSGVATNIVQQDLSFGTSYTVVGRYLPASGLCTVWVNPANEGNADPTVSANATFTAPWPKVSGIGLRSNGGTASPSGTLTINSLVVGTAFADVLPSSAGFNPPFITLQPQDNLSAITNDTVTFNTFAGGDTPLSYQWYSVTNNVTNSISGATATNLVLTAVNTNQSGFYFAVVTNMAGTNVTRLAQLIVYPAPIAVTITNQPQSQTLNVGDTATFTVGAAGVPPPTYQWSVVTNSSGTLKTNVIAGATSPTLTFVNVNTNLSGNAYMVTVANRVNTNVSVKAALTVNPVQVIAIAQLRQFVDSSFAPTNTTSVYTIQGTVTTWTNMTTSTANTEFYMQDGTGGIAVFWSGAVPTNNLPPAGAVVKVTGPLAAFSGLLEIEPVFTNALHKVGVISTGNPLPAAQPMPFDPNVTGNLAAMKAMESTYFVASNVFLTAAATFSSGSNEAITNNGNLILTNTMFGLTFTNLQGETFTMFVNAATDIPGKAKPGGPVTIFGILGYFTAAGFEFTPSRYADIVSYIHVTNVLSHLTRPGDLQTNNYTENFLLPGGTLTTYFSIGDAAGGSVTLTPVMDGLPGTASWSNISNGLPTATALFHFTPALADSGSNYVVNLAVNSTSGTFYTNSFTVYVPATNEQQIAISEFLANPTTNTSAPNFNPLHRSSDTGGITTNDQFIEVVNLSGTDLTSGWTLDNGSRSKLLFDSNAGAGTTVFSSNSVVVYGGDLAETPGLSTPYATSGPLLLPTASSGTLVLRNQNGNIIDRVTYSAGDLSTNGSLARFPTINGPFVPQAYVSIPSNSTTAGLQYDGSQWNLAPKIPTGVPASVTKVGNQFVLSFSANSSQASTLWSGTSLLDPFKVIFGRQFPTISGAFTNSILTGPQFFFITTQ